MIQFETTKATILFVDGLPEDARSFLCNGFVIGFQHEKWRYFSKYKSIDLPEGEWKLIALLKNITEDQSCQILPEKKSLSDLWYDYVKKANFCFSALESLHSLATSLGVKGNCAVLVKGGA